MYLLKSLRADRIVWTRHFHTTTVEQGKAAKRRRMTRIEKAPNLSSNVRSQPKTPSTLALEHFDDAYTKTFGSDWHSIRLALLSKSKFCALINNLVDKETVLKELEEIGCFNIKDLYYTELEKLGETLSVDISLSSHQNEDVESTIKRPSLLPKSDEDDPPRNLVHNSMSPEDAKGRVISPESVVLGSAGLRKSAKSSSMFLHVPSTKLTGMDDFVEESEYYATYEKKSSFPISIKKHPIVAWPENLDVMTFPTGDVQHFQPPRRLTERGHFNYYCLDAASTVPVIMLDIQKGDSVLDMCSGPGGKALVALQTQLPESILCNDNDKERLKRVLNVMDAYAKDLNKDLGFELLKFKLCDGSKLFQWMPNHFDRILCDVPCFTDRHVLQTDDSSIFHPTRSKEKLRMPQYQSQLLQSALMCLKPGGSLVYSTCTMAPVQNDGVVFNALKSIWEDTKIEFSISDLSLAVKPFESMMKFAGKNTGLRYGQLVLPSVMNNFGPIYFSKINRLK